jgi:3-phenylpropionate/trans-cinnamate dioxygenase ferredoxin subunit
MTAQLACSVGDVPLGTALRVELDSVDGREIAVAVVHDENGDFHAIYDVCSHGQVALSDGEVEGCLIECWLHGSQFDLKTGMPMQLPASRATTCSLMSMRRNLCKRRNPHVHS